MGGVMGDHRRPAQARARLWRNVQCGICDKKLKLLAGRETFTCRRGCRKTLPRRLAYPIERGTPTAARKVLKLVDVT